MSLARAFRLSFYVSLGMACVCLFYSEWDFHPILCGLLPVVLALMVLSYRREGRAYVGEGTANFLGIGLAIATFLWVFFKAPRSDADLIAGGLPWPAALIPLLAPLLPMLLIVKLFRPKALADFWIFQLVSAVIVTLACIQAGEILFFFLIGSYLLSLLWTLGLYYFYRHSVQGDPRRVALFKTEKGRKGEGEKGRKGEGEPAAQVDASFSPSPFLPFSPAPLPLLSKALRWTMPILLVGMVLFFLMPRFTDSPWIPSKLSAAGPYKTRTGVGPGIDMFREGVVQLSTETAFKVEVMNKDGLPATLPDNQRWRVQVVENYKRGIWQLSGIWQLRDLSLITHELPLPSEDHLRNNKKIQPGPRAGMDSGQVYLLFHVDHRNVSVVPLADPIAAREDVGLNPCDEGTPSQFPVVRVVSGCDVYVGNAGKFPTATKYGQIVVPSFHVRAVPALDVDDRYINYLRNQEAPASIEPWTRQLLPRMAGLAPADYHADEQGRIAPEKHAKIAQALSRHLAASGEFSYSLTLPRLDPKKDPVADFLLNVKQGHCERFAGGLALMLRSLHIPVRIVKGYLGCEQEEKGRYLVRQDQAHSWVEALVPGDRPGTWQWLQLDPTPAANQMSDAIMPWLNWIWVRVSNPDYLWKSMVMDYNKEKQAEAIDKLERMWKSVAQTDPNRSTASNLWNNLGWVTPILGAIGMVGLVYWGYRRGWFSSHAKRPARMGAPPTFYFYNRLLKVLARNMQLQPCLGQTPLEFAGQARAAMLARALADPFAEIPVRAANLLYRLRFSGQQSLPEECRTIESQVAELESRLAASGK